MINKKLALVLGIGIVLLVAIIFVLQSQNRRDNENQTANIASFEDCVAAGYATRESYPPQCATKDGKTFSQDIGNELEKAELIRLEYPRPNQEISSPIEIRGQARGNWFFEASFPARLLDATGKQLAIVPVQAEEEWMTTNFIPFKAVLNFPVPATPTGTLILDKSNPSGMPEHDDKLVIPVKFSQTSSDKATVKVFFGNSGQGAECEQVAAVQREIPKTSAVGRAAIDQLLAGPSQQEKSQGYLTAISAGTKLNSLTIVNGVASADFSEHLNKDVAGSCRVGAIRSQITETLKQFPTVNQVVISINGQSDGILEP